MAQIINSTAGHKRLRKYWASRVPEIMQMAQANLAGLPDREEIEDICPYWHQDYFDLAERAVRYYRKNASELIRVCEVFNQCVERPFEGVERAEAVFMRRMGDLVGILVADKEIVDAVKGIRTELVRGELQAEPEAIKAIARAKGAQPSVS